MQPSDSYVSPDKLTYLGDVSSQPSRALLIFLKMTKIPFEFKEVSLMAQAQYSKEYKKINPNGKVPAIYDKGFPLSESQACLRYLCRTRNVEDHWYPKDLRKRAKVDEYLDWHHTNLRQAHGSYFFRRYGSPMMGKDIPVPMIQEAIEMIERSLDKIENYWLGDGRDYLCGSQISIADLCASAELFHFKMAGISWGDVNKYPKTAKWIARLEQIPEVREANAHEGANEFLKNVQIMGDKMWEEKGVECPKL